MVTKKILHKTSMFMKEISYFKLSTINGCFSSRRTVKYFTKKTLKLSVFTCFSYRYFTVEIYADLPVICIVSCTFLPINRTC